MNGSNQTTVAVAGGAAALGTIIALVANAAGVDVSNEQATLLGGAVATIVTLIVGYFHQPAGAE